MYFTFAFNETLDITSLNKIFGNNENPKGEKISNYILELFKPSKTV